jgi:hypothetical protein
MHSHALFSPQRRRNVVGFGAVAMHKREGQRNTTVSGAECAPSAVFPSSWSKISEGEGTVTYAEPNTGCGPKKTKVGFPSATISGGKLRLSFSDGPLPPDFDCPYFDGSNEAAEGHELPGATYRETTAKINLARLRAGARKVTATGSAEVDEIETCANIQQGCPEGVTYNASASVKTQLKMVFTRLR